MNSSLRPAVYVPPAAGTAVWLVGDTYTQKLTGAHTGNAFSLTEAVVPPGGGPPPHIHFTEDETFILLAGELVLETPEGRHTAASGALLYVPKGTRHSFQNVGTTPARMLFLYTPAGMEKMFTEIGTPVQPGVPAPAFDPADVARMQVVAAKYHFELLPPA